MLSKIHRSIKKILSRYYLRRFRKVGNMDKNSFAEGAIKSVGEQYIKIGKDFHCGERLKLRAFDCWEGITFHPSIKIGDNVSIETDCHISAVNSVEIGDNVLIASFVFISDHSHGEATAKDLDFPPLQRKLYSKGPIKIGRNVWLGEKVTILGGVSIGESAIIGAGSVVTKNIPARCVAAGNPAKVIKQL